MNLTEKLMEQSHNSVQVNLLTDEMEESRVVDVYEALDLIELKKAELFKEFDEKAKEYENYNDSYRRIQEMRKVVADSLSYTK